MVWGKGEELKTTINTIESYSPTRLGIWCLRGEQASKNEFYGAYHVSSWKVLPGILQNKTSGQIKYMFLRPRPHEDDCKRKR